MNTKWILLPMVLFVLGLVVVPAAWSADGQADLANPAEVSVLTVATDTVATDTVAADTVAADAADEKAAAAECCDKPCIIYRQRGRCRKVCCGCDPPTKTTLKVDDPCCCKTCYDIPICLPACCKGDPCVKGRCGICCKGVVVYKWCCGYKVKVVIKKCGDIVVISYRC